MTGIIQGLLASIGSAVASAASDIYFNLVTLLLNTTSTNGAQNNTFLDSSTNNFTITRNGNTTQGTFTPFSQTGWSNYFDGSGDYLEVASNAAFNIEGGAYTIEGWVYFNSISTAQRIVVLTGSSSTYALIVGTSSTNNLEVNQFGTGTVITATNALVGVTNSWAHICVVSNGTNRSIFVNGTRYATSTSALFQASNNAVGIGGVSGTYSGSNPNAYFSGFRIVKGTAVYDPTLTTLTVPTSPLTAITNTSLLTCQSNRFLDNSTNAFSITVNGNPSVQAFSPFAPTAAYDAAVVGGSGYFDGSGDYLVTPSNAAVSSTLLASDFTIECWLYLTTYPGGGAPIWTNSTSNSDGFSSVYVTSSGTVAIGKVGVNEVVSTATVVRNAWNHFATVRSGSTVYLYLNGAQIASGAASTYLDTSTAKPLQIGQSNQSSPSALTGYFSGYRAVSSALYTGSTYTIPTSVPTAISGTTLLLNFTNSGIYDSTAKNNLETVGNAQVSTTQAKFGTTSMYFDGTGDWLLAPNRSLFDFGSGSFTVEGWFYPTTSSPTSGLITKRANSGVYAPFLIETAASLTPTFYFSTTGSSWNSIASSISFTINTWNHFAITRNGSTFTIWINGSSGGTASTASALMTNTDAVSIGASGVNGDRPVVGYMDDVRITNGLARYTATFTPPTAAFPLQ